jgi:hypothetical protein
MSSGRCVNPFPDRSSSFKRPPEPPTPRCPRYLIDVIGILL